MCELCRGLSDGCPNCDGIDPDFEELLDYELDKADNYNQNQLDESSEI